MIAGGDKRNVIGKRLSEGTVEKSIIQLRIMVVARILTRGNVPSR